MADSDYITEEETSALTGVTPGRLKQLRYERRIYPFYKVEGTRAVHYKRSEIEKIIEAGRVEVRP